MYTYIYIYRNCIYNWDSLIRIVSRINLYYAFSCFNYTTAVSLPAGYVHHEYVIEILINVISSWSSGYAGFNWFLIRLQYIWIIN